MGLLTYFWGLRFFRVGFKYFQGGLRNFRRRVEKYSGGRGCEIFGGVEKFFWGEGVENFFWGGGLGNFEGG